MYCHGTQIAIINEKDSRRPYIAKSTATIVRESLTKRVVLRWAAARQILNLCSQLEDKRVKGHCRGGHLVDVMEEDKVSNAVYMVWCCLNFANSCRGIQDLKMLRNLNSQNP
jgi:hypothetical protein